MGRVDIVKSRDPPKGRTEWEAQTYREGSLIEGHLTQASQHDDLASFRESQTPARKEHNPTRSSNSSWVIILVSLLVGDLVSLIG